MARYNFKVLAPPEGLGLKTRSFTAFITRRRFKKRCFRTLEEFFLYAKEQIKKTNVSIPYRFQIQLRYRLDKRT